MKEIIINNWYGGIADSINENSSFKYETSKHFDIYTDPKRLQPFKNISANNDGISATNEVGNFIVSGTTALALGRATASNITKIFVNSGVNGAWEAETNAEATSANQARGQKLFIKYGSVVFGNRGNFIWSYNQTTDTFNESEQSTGTGTTIYTNGIIGKSNGYLYVPVNNVLYQYTGSAWSTASITIPTGENILGLANYGSYLAILTSASYIYLWDFASLLASEIIELAEGSYTVLGSIGNTLVAVGQKDTPVGSELQISQYSGGNPEVIFRKILPSTVSVVRGVCRLKYGRMFFAVNDTTTGRPYQGIWSIGRHKTGYPYSVTISFDYLENGGTASNILNFDLDTTQIYITTEDYLVHKLSSSAYATVNPISTLITSKYFADSEARLVSTQLKYDKLPSAGIANLYYRANDDTSWTQISTDTTDNSISKISTNIESTGVDFPLFKNIQFKIESLGGAVINEFRFKFDEQNTIYG